MDESGNGTTMSQDEAQRFAGGGALKEELQRRGLKLQAAGLSSGGLNLIGLLEDVLTDHEIDEFVASVYAARALDVPREANTAGSGK